ncbi:AAA family ATPase [Formosa undariae]|uniref:AAA family ATPase n=1 Tax=Formosa undariae TaxID=1325436 RepID=A0ABV5EZE9_9FLAO
MKIKKVEISAFRAYDNVEHSTFDFSIGKDTANFISIYAPNGYGKTSFYDAVEWGVTGQISRFQKNASENQKIGKENRKINKDNYLLQHKGQDKLGFVDVFTNDTKKIFPKRNISNSKVYNFKKEPINGYFRDVVLSQDLIDSFIKEEKADDRYKKFISNIPHLNDSNIGLQNLDKLIEITEKEIYNLNKQKLDLENKQLQFDFEGDSKVLEEINNSISFLINKEEELSLIKKNYFEKTEHTVLTQKIDSSLTELKIDIEHLKLRSKNIQLAFNGSKDDENKSGVIQYYNNIEKSKVLNQEIKSLTKILSDLKEKEILEKTSLELNKELDKNINTLDESLKIKKQYPRYLTILDNINQLEKKKKESIKLNEDQKTVLQQLNLSLSNLKIGLSNHQDKIITLNKKLEKVNLFEATLKKKNEEQEILLKKMSTLEVDIKKTIDLVKNSTNKIEANKVYLIKLDNDIELLLDDSLFKDYENEIQQVIESRIEIAKLGNELSILNLQIDNQKNLNSELKEFISKGLNLISEKEESSCPLCQTNFKTFSELSNKISSNPLIDDLLKLNLTIKANLETKKSKLQKQNSNVLNKLKEYIKTLVSKEEINKTKHINELERLNLILKKNNESLSLLKEEITIALQFFEGLKINDFKDKISTEFENHKNQINELNTQINDTNLSIQKSTEIINKSLKELELFKNSILKEEENEVFILIVNYFRETLKTNSIDSIVLNTFISQLETTITSIKENIKNENLKLKKLKEILVNNDLSKKEINKKIDQSSILESSNNKTIKNFENFIFSEYKINLSNLLLKDTTDQFDSLKNKISKQIEVKQEIQKHYEIVQNLKDNVLNFLETEKIKENINSLRKEIGTLEKVKTALENEKKNLEVYLKETIDNFFYTELINKIYSKIDPHPDNYKIEFDCDFSESKPRLQIYTVDPDGKKSIPALYFSSAQINILSLSIFLARALKATNPETKEPIKCIFIDDPIQSMDSINILSFIDLFRSLTINLDSQLIVSTHEENFHLLLQKKIPEKLLKSKFIQFETFGKLETIRH